MLSNKEIKKREIRINKAKLIDACKRFRITQKEFLKALCADIQNAYNKKECMRIYPRALERYISDYVDILQTRNDITKLELWQVED